jgi:hypothetical protein
MVDFISMLDKLYKKIQFWESYSSIYKIKGFSINILYKKRKNNKVL